MSDSDHVTDDVDFESEDDLGAVAALKVKIRALHQSLEQCRKERQEYLDGWQRSKADGINARKEAIASADRLATRSKETLIEDIIPTLDAFDMAMNNESWSKMDSQWRSGIEFIRNQLSDALTRNGVEAFGKVGDPLDHNLHEVVSEIADDEGDSQAIVRVVRKGYKASDRILRPAHVVIKK